MLFGLGAGSHHWHTPALASAWSECECRLLHPARGPGFHPQSAELTSMLATPPATPPATLSATPPAPPPATHPAHTVRFLSASPLLLPLLWSQLRIWGHCLPPLLSESLAIHLQACLVEGTAILRGGHLCVSSPTYCLKQKLWLSPSRAQFLLSPNMAALIVALSVPGVTFGTAEK